MSNSNESVRSWADIGFRIFTSSISHPFEYAKVLMQIGYEPIPPYPSRTLFGKPTYALPNYFTYVGHIKKVDGFVGIYRGLTPKLASQLVNICVYNSALDSLKGNKEPKPEEELSEKEKFQLYLRDLSKDLVARTACIVASHPFYVVSVRMMAQFIGRETKYSSVLSSFFEIYRESGISGYFSGIIPRVLEDLLAVIMTSSITYLICRHKFSEEAEFKFYISTMASLVARSFTYPFLVVSTCMAVTGSGLQAGNPPYMPLYKNSLDCWMDLAKNKDLKRGASFVWRYYSGPPIFHTPAGPVYLKQL